MSDLVCTVPVLKTLQDLEQAVKFYKANSNLSSIELFCHWQAIREASLELNPTIADNVEVPGSDSY